MQDYELAYCPDCAGSGMNPYASGWCWTCKGEGEIMLPVESNIDEEEDND